ncbi:LEM-3-like GIY-YIG domain-containing protein [Nitriliruptor alkaliphilus]|uniref:LEM-3-like GIY-YIG domain-containing protein n=1 Tax=Nitriliruptor alkaliphilus TaxID=427918 RepID=UPI0009F85737|nr:hypothetical protein [Nitriliruptor alkaliphilus]
MLSGAQQGADLTGFPAGVIDKLGFYVYRLVDPRTGNTFYVGKGKGNRVFEHAHGNVSAEEFGDEQLEPKLGLIRDIQLAGLTTSHVIHRHGLDEATAFEVEAALMDAYPGLTNIQGGHGSSERGTMHVKEIIDMHQRRTADFADEPVLVIKIQKSLEEGKSLYDAVRVAWKLNPANAEKAAWVAAASKGVILDVYEPNQWLPASDPEFDGLIETEIDQDRYGFVGTLAPDKVRSRWKGKALPPELTRRGAASPVRYVNIH